MVRRVRAGRRCPRGPGPNARRKPRNLLGRLADDERGCRASNVSEREVKRESRRGPTRGRDGGRGGLGTGDANKGGHGGGGRDGLHLET